MPPRFKPNQGEKYGYWEILEANVINPNTLETDYIGKDVFSKCLCTYCNSTIQYIKNNQLKEKQKTNSACKHCAPRIRAEKQRSIKLNDTFGKLTVIGDGGYQNNRHYSICKCECGNIIKVKDNALQSGNNKSCGCMISKGEETIKNILIENNYIFDHDAILPDFLKETKLRYRFDFIIYNEDGSIKCLIEYDGRQHFYGPDTNYWGHSIDTLKTIQQRDSIKNNFCLSHNYPLYRIPFTQLNNLNINNLFSDEYLVKGDNK